MIAPRLSVAVVVVVSAASAPAEGIKFQIGVVDASPQGAQVVRVDRGGIAEKLRLQPGDVIVQFNRLQIRSAADLVRELARFEREATVYWQRDGKRYRGVVKRVVATPLGQPPSVEIVVERGKPVD